MENNTLIFGGMLGGFVVAKIASYISYYVQEVKINREREKAFFLKSVEDLNSKVTSFEQRITLNTETSFKKFEDQLNKTISEALNSNLGKTVASGGGVYKTYCGITDEAIKVFDKNLEEDNRVKIGKASIFLNDVLTRGDYTQEKDSRTKLIENMNKTVEDELDLELKEELKELEEEKMDLDSGNFRVDPKAQVITLMNSIFSDKDLMTNEEKQRKAFEKLSSAVQILSNIPNKPKPKPVIKPELDFKLRSRLNNCSIVTPDIVITK
jgi:hypothetical protein